MVRPLSVFDNPEQATRDDGITCDPITFKSKSPKIEWIDPGRIPLGFVSLIQGAKGAGKSTYVAALVADATGGNRLARRAKRRWLGNVLYLTAEDDMKKLVFPRIKAAGGRTKCLHWPHESGDSDPARIKFPGYYPKLEEWINKWKIKLVVIDPFPDYVHPGWSCDNEQHMRQVLAELVDIARRTGCAIVLVRHLSKRKTASALDRGMGSVGIAAVCRIVLNVGPIPDRPGLSAVVRLPSNIGPTPPPLVFELKKKQGNVTSIIWRPKIHLTTDDLESDQLDAGDQEGNDLATVILQGCTKNGWCPLPEIIKRGARNGIQPHTLRARKRVLGMTRRH